MKYSVGQKVKIISMNKVRSYPVDIDGYRSIGYPIWISDMDKFTGTIQEIKWVDPHYRYYKLEDDPGAHSFSPEMIEGPADTVEEEVRGNTKGTGGKPTSLNWVDPEKRAVGRIQRQEGQEEKKWTDRDMKDAFKEGFTNWGNEKWETADEWFSNYTIARKK